MTSECTVRLLTNETTARPVRLEKHRFIVLLRLANVVDNEWQCARSRTVHVLTDTLKRVSVSPVSGKKNKQTDRQTDKQTKSCISYKSDHVASKVATSFSFLSKWFISQAGHSRRGGGGGRGILYITASDWRVLIHLSGQQTQLTSFFSFFSSISQV